MAIGLPAHRATQVLSRAYTRGQHALAFTLLGGLLLIALALGAQLGPAMWLSALALALAIVVLGIRRQTDSDAMAVLYLLVGAAALFLFAHAFLSKPDAGLTDYGYSLVAAKTALVMAGTSRVGARPSVGWTIAGYLVAEGAVLAASVLAGRFLDFDLTTLAIAVASVALRPLVSATGGGLREAQPRLYRAAREEELSALRHRIEVKAAALMHDTVLGHLGAIASAPDGALDPRMRTQIERDLQLLLGEDWLSDETPGIAGELRADWQHSGLFAAIQEGRLLGLEVQTTGELGAVGRLDRQTSIAMGQAVKQCLVNVSKHSGTMFAEVAVYAAGNELCVMVIDSGKGFDEASAPRDRMGLRTSVHQRIEAVGGQAQVWSTPGRGTSIMLRVPTAGQDPRDGGSS